jgi:hypothetical protein
MPGKKKLSRPLEEIFEEIGGFAPKIEAHEKRLLGL